jgi:hypothetical protein
LAIAWRDPEHRPAEDRMLHDRMIRHLLQDWRYRDAT